MSHLALVNTETGEVEHHGCPECAEKDSEIDGLQITIRSQAGIIGKQRAELEERIDNHPRRAEILSLIDYWRESTGHKRSKASKDRVQLVIDRLKDDYSPEQIRLAIDGLAAFPYRSYGERLTTGSDSQRDDQMSVALKSGEALEKFAVLGHRASSLPPHKGETR